MLVNMASVYVQKPVDELTVEDWDTQMACRPARRLAVRACRRAAYAPARGGRIINFSATGSRGAAVRATRLSALLRRESGVIALTEALALELAADQILVNAIAPGPIVAPPGTIEADSTKVERATPLGRWGGEIEIAKAVLALVDSDFITGETIRVDGGRHLK